MTSTKTPWWVYASLLATAGFALFSMSFRYRMEERNKAVELVAEIDQISALAASQGLALDEALHRLKERGLGGVVLSEQTVGELVDEGWLTLDRRPKDAVFYSLHPGKGVFSGDSGSVARAERGLMIRTGQFGQLSALSMPATPDFPIAQIRSVAVGLNPRDAEIVGKAGLRIIARCTNPTGASPATVKGTVDWAYELGADVLLPEGEQTLGRRDALGTLVDALKANRMLYASPEFSKLGGDSNVLTMAPEICIRLHAAQEVELDKLDLSSAVDRYARAGRERNVRMLLVRPLTLAADAPLDEFGGFLGAIRSGLSKEGGAVGRAKPFEEAEVPAWVFPAIGLATVPMAAFVAGAFARKVGRIGPTLQVGLVGVVAAILGVAAYSSPLREFTALWCAMVFPIAGFVALDRLFSSGSAAPRFATISGYALATVFSLVGGFCVAGLLTGVPYAIRAEQFFGVKLAHFAPVLIIGLLFFLKIASPGEVLKNPITWLQGLLAIVVLVGLALMFARTGNDNPAAVSGFELKLREVLDKVLFVRPRTKELLIGHPAMIVGLGLLALGIRRRGFGGWAALALMVGAIGQTSIVNTMCHLHTPLVVSLTRIGVGLALGGIIGGVLWLALVKFLPRDEV